MDGRSPKEISDDIEAGEIESKPPASEPPVLATLTTAQFRRNKYLLKVTILPPHPVHLLVHNLVMQRLHRFMIA